MKTGLAHFGVTLNISPAVKGKRVVLHALPCPSYTQKQPARRGAYTFKRNFGSFAEAMRRVSEWTLEWHAPIQLCGHCLKSGRFP